MNAKMTVLCSIFLAFAALSGPVRADYTCLDNTTLKYNTTISVDGIDIPIIQTEPCEYGCDNATAACAPPEGQQSLIIFGFIAAICIGGTALWRWAR